MMDGGAYEYDGRKMHGSGREIATPDRFHGRLPGKSAEQERVSREQERDDYLASVRDEYDDTDEEDNRE